VGDVFQPGLGDVVPQAGAALLLGDDRDGLHGAPFAAISAGSGAPYARLTKAVPANSARWSGRWGSTGGGRTSHCHPSPCGVSPTIDVATAARRQPTTAMPSRHRAATAETA